MATSRGSVTQPTTKTSGNLPRGVPKTTSKGRGPRKAGSGGGNTPKQR
jgi:hypothetical protein